MATRERKVGISIVLILIFLMVVVSFRHHHDCPAIQIACKR